MRTRTMAIEQVNAGNVTTATEIIRFSAANGHPLAAWENLLAGVRVSASETKLTPKGRKLMVNIVAKLSRSRAR